MQSSWPPTKWKKSCNFECRFFFPRCCLMNMLLWLHLGLISVHIQDGSGSNETDGKCLLAVMISISCNIPMSNFVCCIDLLKVTVECLSIFESPKTITMMFFGFSLPRNRSKGKKNQRLNVWKEPRWSLCRCGWAVTTVVDCFTWGLYYAVIWEW